MTSMRFLLAVHALVFAGFMGTQATTLWKEDVDTVPKDVNCTKVRKCDDHNVCVVVCERGSVEIAPWADKALALQRKLAYTHSICHAQFPGTHNSAITIVDGYGVEDHVFQSLLSYVPWMPPHVEVHTNDQLFSLTDQLRLGARLLELDVHWVDDDLRIAHCGGFESPLLDDLISWLNKIAKTLGIEIEWDSETVGCMPSLSSIPAHSQRPVIDALNEIATWLHRPENREEFLLIYFDDEFNLLKWHKVPLLLSYIEKAFPIAEILRPADVQGTWPSYETLIAKGKRVAFLTATDYSPVGSPILFHKSSLCRWQEPELPLKPYPTCRFHDWTSSTIENYDMIFRPETSEIQYGILNAMGHIGPNLHLINEAVLPKLLECNVKIPSPDNITPKRMEAMIWSFAPHEPSDASSCVVMNRASSRWVSASCTSMSVEGGAIGHVCGDKNISSWHIVADTSKCPSGKTPIPTNGYENRVVHDLLKASKFGGVWINIPSTSYYRQLYKREHVYDLTKNDLST